MTYVMPWQFSTGYVSLMTQTIGKVMQPAAAMAVNDWLKSADDKGTDFYCTLIVPLCPL